MALIVVAFIAAGCGGRALISPRSAVSGLYVANTGNNSITVYAPSAGGPPGSPAANVAPIRIISGASTELSNPWGVALDTAGNLYVTNSNSITVYAPGAGGPPGSPAANVAPLRSISGARTGLQGPIGVAVDAASNLYVSNTPALIITVYAPGTGGPPGSPAADVAPIRASFGALTPRGVALDITGNLYVVGPAAYEFAGRINFDRIAVFAPGAGGLMGTGAANAGPARTLEGADTGLNQPTGVAVDATRNLYVANAPPANSITVYPPGVGGFWASPAANVPPLRTISGGSTGLDNPWGVALDAAGNLYVSNAPANSITVYGRGAGGPPGSSAANVAPLRTISGANTGLSNPYLIFLRP